MIKEGSTEMSESAVRLLAEDREALKDVLLKGDVENAVDTRDGPASLCVSKSSISLKSKFGGTTVLELANSTIALDPDDPDDLTLNQLEPAKPIKCSVESAERPAHELRDLLILSARCFVSLAAEPSFEGTCRVWEGDGYGDYYGRLHGQVMMLFEGKDAPAAGDKPTEALLLHGCRAESIQNEAEDEENGPELSITDSGGEIFSLSLADDATSEEWKEAIESRAAPPAIARASHILVKHAGSRRRASWRDPEGVAIEARSEGAAKAMLAKFRAQIERGEGDVAGFAETHSDCDTAKHGGDLGWFAANYMQPEFEEAVLALEVGQLSQVVTTASGLHLIQRTG